MKRTHALGFVVLTAVFALWTAAGTVAVREAQGKTAVPKKESPVREATCYECHDGIEALKKGNRHAKVNCVSCHTETDQKTMHDNPAVVLGCTEIPLLITPDVSPLPTLESTNLLAKAAVEVALGERPMPTWRGGPV